nr:MAG TPA: hypothetical protein [Caudoviricetes sp.]
MKCLFLYYNILFLIGSDELPKSECYHHSYVILMTKRRISDSNRDTDYSATISFQD